MLVMAHAIQGVHLTISSISCFETTSWLRHNISDPLHDRESERYSRRMSSSNRPNTHEKLQVLHRPPLQVSTIRHDLLRPPALDDIHSQRVRRITHPRDLDVRLTTNVFDNQVPYLLRWDTNTGVDDGHGMIGDLVGDGAAGD